MGGGEGWGGLLFVFKSNQLQLNIVLICHYTYSKLCERIANETVIQTYNSIIVCSCCNTEVEWSPEVTNDVVNNGTLKQRK